MRSQYLLFRVVAQDVPRVGLRRTDGVDGPAGQLVESGSAGDLFPALLPALNHAELFELGRLAWDLADARLRKMSPVAEPPTEKVTREQVEAARAAAAWEDDGGRPADFPGDAAATVFG